MLDINKIYCGDNLKLMTALDDNSVDSIVTDPPYGLSDKRSSERIFDIFKRRFNIVFPNFNEFNAKRLKYSDLLRISLQGTDLSKVEIMNVIKSFVSMPESPIDFDSNIKVGDKKVNTSGVSTSNIISDSILMNKVNFKGSKYIGDYILDFGNSLDFTSSNVGSSNIGEYGFSFFTMPISSILTSFRPCQMSDDASPLLRDRINDIIGFRNDSLGQASRTSFILASGGAENSLMLRFDLTNTTGDFNATISTVDGNTVSNFICPKLIRTNATASSLSAKLESCTVSFIAASADGTDSIYYFHLYLPKDLFNNIHNSFEKASGFMGKKWDYEIPSVKVWKECLRVLKPGGHALIACGTRTQHRMAVNIEDAGFEIRDLIAWVYGSGFPKSLSISKQLDKMAGTERKVVGLRKHPTLKDTSKIEEQANASHGSNKWAREWNVTAPATPEAKQWDGWGTALKPAMELWTLCRKPLSEKTVAPNVLKWGTGGINVDGCRVRTEEKITNHSRGVESAISKGKYGDSVAQETYQTTGQQLGRFPANLILTYPPDEYILREDISEKNKKKVLKWLYENA